MTPLAGAPTAATTAIDVPQPWHTSINEEADEHGVVIPYDCWCQSLSPRSDAVKQFVASHADEITGVLSGFDRLIFRGHLMPLNHEGGVRGFLDAQDVLLKDFEEFAKVLTALIRDGAEEAVQALDRPIIKLESSRIKKDDLARKVLAERPIRSGPICLMTILEPCSTWQVWRSKERAHPQQVRRKSSKCLALYTYFIDDESRLRAHAHPELAADADPDLRQRARVARSETRPRTHAVPPRRQLLPVPR